ncbi:MAG: hypothetical protein Q8M07_30870 [Prosthecobacter sp.]|nr:hypothetical protein [Prosthecobacter sp.]
MAGPLREHVRADGTLKPDPFMPYKWVELSVTRHLGLEESEIWQAGQIVADETGNTLQGRADVQAQVYVRHKGCAKGDRPHDCP